MSNPTPTKGGMPRRPPGPSLFGLLKPYRGLVLVLVAMTVLGNSLNLIVPTILSRAIDTYNRQQLVMRSLVIGFLAVAAGIFIFSYLQAIVQTYASERVARDLRTKLVYKISNQDHEFIQQATPALG